MPKKRKFKASGSLGKKQFKIQAEISNVNSKDDDSKIFAFLAAFLSIVGFIIALIARRKDKYVMFYAKQSLVVFIFSVVGSIATSIFKILPITGAIISIGINITVFLAWLISWLYALSGEMKPVPIIGKFAERFRF